MTKIEQKWKTPYSYIGDGTQEYIYRWNKLPERKGQRCKVRARGGMNSCCLVFEDGFQVITSRNSIMKVHTK